MKIMSINNLSFHEARKQLVKPNYYGALEDNAEYPDLPRPNRQASQKMQQTFRQQPTSASMFYNVSDNNAQSTPGANKRRRGEANKMNKFQRGEIPTEQPTDHFAGKAINQLSQVVSSYEPEMLDQIVTKLIEIIPKISESIRQKNDQKLIDMSIESLTTTTPERDQLNKKHKSEEDNTQAPLSNLNPNIQSMLESETRTPTNRIQQSKSYFSGNVTRSP